MQGLAFIDTFIVKEQEKSNFPKTRVSRIVITCFNFTVTIMCFAFCLQFIAAPINYIIMIMRQNICPYNDDAGRPTHNTLPCSLDCLAVVPFSVSSRMMTLPIVLKEKRIKFLQTHLFSFVFS